MAAPYGARLTHPSPVGEGVSQAPRVIPLAWVVAPALLAALILAGFYLYGKFMPYTPAVPAVPSATGGLEWGGTTIWTKPEMQLWLEQHGAPYRRWAKRHPAGVAIIVPRLHPHAHRATAATKHRHAPARKHHRRR